MILRCVDWLTDWLISPWSLSGSLLLPWTCARWCCISGQPQYLLWSQVSGRDWWSSNLTNCRPALSLRSLEGPEKKDTVDSHYRSSSAWTRETRPAQLLTAAQLTQGLSFSFIFPLFKFCSLAGMLGWGSENHRTSCFGIQAWGWAWGSVVKMLSYTNPSTQSPNTARKWKNTDIAWRIFYVCGPDA